jgi:hypothetical protein
MVTEPLKWYDENADNPVWGLGRGPAQGDPAKAGARWTSTHKRPWGTGSSF